MKTNVKTKIQVLPLTITGTKTTLTQAVQPLRCIIYPNPWYGLDCNSVSYENS